MQEITKNSPFYYIEFIDKDGIDHAVSGVTADISDRNYYIEEMKGNSGIEVVFRSRIINETLVIFYELFYQNVDSEISVRC